MFKLNHIQYPEVKTHTFDEAHSLEALKSNFEFDKCRRNFKNKFGFEELNTFSFSEDGFIAMMIKLQGKIAVSLGESQAIVSAAHKCKALGLDITFLGLNKEGSVELEPLKAQKFDYIFISSYVMDTYVKSDLNLLKEVSSAAIIANVSNSFEYMDIIDVALFDVYKLTGFQTHSVVLHNGLLEEQFLSQYDFIALSMIYDAVLVEREKTQIKEQFITILQKELEGNMFFFVDNALTLDNTINIGLKGIKAREIIRTLALNSIYVTNGEGCSLGLSRPSKIIQAMGYSEDESRQAISLSFNKNLTEEEMTTIAKEMAKKYRQIRRFD